MVLSKTLNCKRDQMVNSIIGGRQMLTKLNLQRFADDETETKTEPKTQTFKEDKPQPRTFSEDYVQALREEAKTNRLAKKQAEAKLKLLIGLKDDEDYDDAKITAYQNNQNAKLEAVMKKANERLIAAELKALDGYDTKLVDRLIDKSKIKIDEDGKITGLTEELATLEADFPQIKVVGKRQETGTNPPPKQTDTPQQEYEEVLKLAQANPRDGQLQQKLFALRERLINQR